MKNRFFEHPNESNIKETGEHFCLHDAVIAIDNYDGREFMDGAENAIVLSGKESPEQRRQMLRSDTQDMPDNSQIIVFL